MKWLLSRIAILVVGLLLPVTMMELGMRLLFPDVAVRQFDPVYGGLPRPNLNVRTTYGVYESVVNVRTDSSGLRVDETLPRPRSDATRILALGDSFTFGDELGAANTWPSQLERILDRDRPGGPYLAINGGVSDFGTGQELLQYRRLRLQVRPRIVILGVFLGNDILDNLCLEDGTLRRRSDLPCFTLRSGELVQNAPTPKIEAGTGLFPALANLRSAQLISFQARRATVWNPRFLRAASRLGIHFSAIKHEGFVESWYDKKYFEPGWTLTRELLAELASEVASDGASLVVLIIPDPIQVVPLLQQSRTMLSGDDESMGTFVEDTSRPQRLLADLCHQLKIACVDPLPELRAAGLQGKELYFTINRHWTALADQIAARAIAEQLNSAPSSG